jgi:hypothetical protein
MFRLSRSATIRETLDIQKETSRERGLILLCCTYFCVSVIYLTMANLDSWSMLQYIIKNYCTISIQGAAEISPTLYIYCPTKCGSYFCRTLYIAFFFTMTQQPLMRPGPPHYRGFMIILRHTTLGRTPLNEWSARRRDLYLTTHNTHNIQTPMLPAEFETTMPADEGQQTHSLDRAATGIGIYCDWSDN